MENTKSVNDSFDKVALNKMKNELGELQANLPTQIKYMGVMATLHRAKFKALMDEGFTREESLELCKRLYSA